MFEGVIQPLSAWLRSSKLLTGDPDFAVISLGGNTGRDTGVLVQKSLKDLARTKEMHHLLMKVSTPCELCNEQSQYTDMETKLRICLVRVYSYQVLVVVSSFQISALYDQLALRRDPCFLLFNSIQKRPCSPMTQESSYLVKPCTNGPSSLTE